ncbi:MAG: helix-turn-helix transcriptional regulator [Oscillospiraceae bacterium]|nr:helix-turn-helix transcriptional regulator [Oscillospiraceae bacterium]
MANKVGPLIKEARTNAGLSQEALAKKIDGVSASDISKAERGEKELTQAVLKQIAKITGVTQTSLLEAAKSGTTAAKKTASMAKKTTTTAKKTTASTKKTTADTYTAAEKKLVELYRAADSDTKKKAVAVLKGEAVDTGDILTSLIGSAIDMFGKK